MWEFFVGLGKVLWVLFQVIVLFNFLIVVHELGHYWAALWRGLKVEKFQIWFGKPIWKKEINGVQWGLGSIPLGGFVALPQMAPMDAIEGGTGEREKLPAITPLDKIIVAFAGPLFSFLLAGFFAVLVWQVGKPSSISATTNVVGYVADNMPAAEVLRPGDEILEIDGVKVTGFGGMVDSITERIVYSTGDKIKILVQRDGSPVELEVAYQIEETAAYRRPGHRRVGVGPMGPAFVGALQPKGPAVEAGLEVGDEILEANGEKIYSPSRLLQMGWNSKGAPITLIVKRGAEEKTLTLTPQQPEKGPVRKGPDGKPVEPAEILYQIGIVWDGSKGRTIAPGAPPHEQLAHSATAMFRTLKAVTSKDSDIKVSHMSSAVGIGGLYYDALSVEGGWRWALAISVLINVNLALLNLLPLPVLDGGHITMALYEAARKKPLNIRILEYVQITCVLLLFGFMAYVTFFDIGDRVRVDDKVEVEWGS